MVDHELSVAYRVALLLPISVLCRLTSPHYAYLQHVRIAATDNPNYPIESETDETLQIRSPKP